MKINLRVRNMGPTDRRVRVGLIAPALLVAGLALGPGGVLPAMLYALAAVMVATSLGGSCPVYTLVGIRTCEPPTTPDSRSSSAVSR